MKAVLKEFQPEFDPDIWIQDSEIGEQENRYGAEVQEEKQGPMAQTECDKEKEQEQGEMLILSKAKMKVQRCRMIAKKTAGRLRHK